jgi:CubicO group peptidase (beta-lactamase class C family)
MLSPEVHTMAITPSEQTEGAPRTRRRRDRRAGSRQHRYASIVLFVTLALAATAVGQAADPLSSKTVSAIDAAVNEELVRTGAPSASVAVVQNGAIVLAKAYGLARIDPPTPTTASMRYPIGSISKQFTAAAVAILAEEGKLGLDDPVAGFFPDLTRADEITIRQLLSHTAGIRDYWPQDYVPPAMHEPITTEALIGQWATQPLDFEPGSMYQYSNTGYVIAGAIVEKVSGKSLIDFFRERFFEPLGMDSVVDIDQGALSEGDPKGYQRFALGPLRPAPKDGRGWLFAAGPLAMTAADLAKWNVALIEGTVPGPEVFGELTREVVLDAGVGAGYGLGLRVTLEGNHRLVGHGGEVSGFTASNRLYPEEQIATVVLVNQDAVSVASTIGKRISELLFVTDSPEEAEILARVREIFDGLRKGKLDRSLFTANANAYFSEAALADIKAGLKKFDSPKTLTQRSRSLRGGLITRVYRAVFKNKTLEIVTRATPDGKFEQYIVRVA